MLEGLIERFQDKASEAEDQVTESGTSMTDGNSGNRRNESSANEATNNPVANNSGNQSSSNSISVPTPTSSAADTSSPGLGSMPDLIPDLSGINPKHVFIFFAVAGLVLFVGYLLTQSLVGNEVSSRKRQIIKQVRNTKIQSPKDLVESVDMFLLAKFGIKSSWWNARLAQRILHSGSAELQGQVDELFRDYVRARYMRNDIQIPATDQQRYRKTLEDLSMLDIKPDSKLDFGSVKPGMESSVSLEA